MISRIREKIHVSSHKYILWGFLVVFIVSSLSLGILFKDNNNSIMRINNYSIDKVEFSQKLHAIDQQIQALRSQLGDQFLRSLGLAGDPALIALQELKKEKLLLSAADKMGIASLSEAYISQKLNNSTFSLRHLGMLVHPYFYNSLGELDGKAISNYLHRQGISSSNFINMVEDALRQYLVVSTIPTALYVSQDTISKYDGYSCKRIYKVFELKSDDYVKALRKTSISEKALRDYFEQQNSDYKKYWSEEKYFGRAWKFSRDHYGKNIAAENFASRFPGDVRRIIAQHDKKALDSFIQKHNGEEINLKHATHKDKDSKEIKFLFDKLASIKKPGKFVSAFLTIMVISYC